MEGFVKKLASYPELLSTNDLCELGLYKSQGAAYIARKKGNSPDYLVMPHRILYARSSVIQFLKNRFKKGDKSSNEATTNEPA